MKIYDVETFKPPEEVEGGWQNPEGMGFGTAVMYDTVQDLYKFYGPNDREVLIQDLSGHGVASFNGIKFDNRVLLGNDLGGSTPWHNYDLLLEVVCSKFPGTKNIKEAEEKYGANHVHNGSIGLNGLSVGTLRHGKTGHGSKSPLWIRNGEWARVFAYNLEDVRLTCRLIYFAQEYGFLLDQEGTKIELPTIATWE